MLGAWEVHTLSSSLLMVWVAIVKVEIEVDGNEEKGWREMNGCSGCVSPTSVLLNISRGSFLRR